ncbi:hypothetical protein ZHAS_00018097 [Anopheles sinensis]|uniref:Uncharacterized protein n=1 Tax=Anopheles sinensis TaxID=74873 RepID=A0A084WIK5_ANOSI|nr:hypothetical protein ZHAS_00018097 [Anopheles sinensis]
MRADLRFAAYINITSCAPNQGDPRSGQHVKFPQCEWKQVRKTASELEKVSLIKPLKDTIATERSSSRGVEENDPKVTRRDATTSKAHARAVIKYQHWNATDISCDARNSSTHVTDEISVTAFSRYPATSPHGNVGYTAVTITPAANDGHHLTLPRASKAPLPPIRTTTSSPSTSTGSSAPLTSILVNSTSNHQHHHHHNYQGQGQDKVITVDLVNSTTGTGSPASSGGHQHHHHLHHHAHHHTTNPSGVGTSGPAAATAASAATTAGNTATLKKRVQIQEVTV